jgi:hypothetical protein
VPGRKTVKSKRRKREGMRAEENALSRREFARRAAVAAAAMAAMPGDVLGMVNHGRTASRGEEEFAPIQEVAGGGPKLSAESLAEVDGKVADIFRRYGEKLSEEQKADVRRLVREAQVPLEALRAYPLENSDEPATILHLARGSSRSAGTPRGTPGAPEAAKKPAAGGE